MSRGICHQQSLKQSGFFLGVVLVILGCGKVSPTQPHYQAVTVSKTIQDGSEKGAAKADNGGRSAEVVFEEYSRTQDQINQLYLELKPDIREKRLIDEVKIGELERLVNKLEGLEREGRSVSSLEKGGMIEFPERNHQAIEKFHELFRLQHKIRLRHQLDSLLVLSKDLVMVSGKLKSDMETNLPIKGESMAKLEELIEAFRKNLSKIEPALSTDPSLKTLYRHALKLIQVSETLLFRLQWEQFEDEARKKDPWIGYQHPGEFS